MEDSKKECNYFVFHLYIDNIIDWLHSSFLSPDFDVTNSEPDVIDLTSVIATKPPLPLYGKCRLQLVLAIGFDDSDRVR